MDLDELKKMADDIGKVRLLSKTLSINTTADKLKVINCGSEGIGISVKILDYGTLYFSEDSIDGYVEHKFKSGDEFIIYLNF